MKRILFGLLLATAAVLPSLAQAPFDRTGLTVSRTASNVSASAALATGSPSVWVCNPGTTLAYINFGDSTVTATSTAGTPLPAGVCGTLSPKGSTHFAVILASGTTTITATPGTGILDATGGGGGTGGAATIADGADVTEGAIADAASTAGGTGTVSAKLRLVTSQLDAINTNIQGSVPTNPKSTTQAKLTVAVTNTYQQALASSASRVGCTIQYVAVAGTKGYVYFGTAPADTTTSFQLTNGQTVACNIGGVAVAQDAIQVTATGTDIFIVANQ